MKYVASTLYKFIETLFEEKVKAQTNRILPLPPFHMAAKEGNLSDLEIILYYGRDINERDRYGKTALHYAAENGHKYAVERLLRCKANVEIEDNFGLTASTLAAFKYQEEIVTLLAEYETSN